MGPPWQGNVLFSMSLLQQKYPTKQLEDGRVFSADSSRVQSIMGQCHGGTRTVCIHVIAQMKEAS